MESRAHAWFAAWFCVWAVLGSSPAAAEDEQRLVFGSFATRSNAERYADEVGRRLDLATEVLVVPAGATTPPMYRVTSQPLSPVRVLAVTQAARAAGLDSWRLTQPRLIETESQPVPATAVVVESPRQSTRPHVFARQPASGPIDRAAEPADLDIDLGFQSRSYAERGSDGQARWQPSLSGRLDWAMRFADDRFGLRASPFVRLDAEDSERTHADFRELYVDYVADNWEIGAGLRQVFWGVTEFHHLVDVINQTDLVENVDGEDKLGQPMVNLSWITNFGIVELYLLPGFRERTFAGEDGRLRYLLPVSTRDTSYESNQEAWHLDGAVRWVHSVGPVEFGLYQFAGTSRDPTMRLVQRPGGEWMLAPYYPLIDQTGLDAQAILGDWAIKLEALSRGGDGERYTAATGGFERTLVGVLGTRADLGLVLEYTFDERGDDANTVFERDIAFGTRFRFNDVADTQTLLGIIWDHETDEYIVKLEGSRRLGDHWALIVEGRLFGGVGAVDLGDIGSVLNALDDPDRKTAAFARDDFLQLELTRYF